jgi:protein-disulfide isomerase
MAILKTPINKNDHIRGPANAPVSLVEYGDYECPHCGLVYPTVKRVQSHFRRQLRFVFRHFPPSEVHPYAEIAAEGAEFAGAAGMFWDMHDALFESQSMLERSDDFPARHRAWASGSGDAPGLETGEHRKKVRSDFMSGIHSGVNGTPTFFINGARHDGAYDYASLVSGIQMRLAAATGT